jgi:enoyl-[acyl-carrier-protein] reductase (NADH)
VARRAASQGVPAEEVEKQLAALNLVGKLISAEEIAHVVAFLASPKSIAINGDVIAAGGGTRGAIYY